MGFASGLQCGKKHAIAHPIKNKIYIFLKMYFVFPSYVVVVPDSISVILLAVLKGNTDLSFGWC